MNQALPGIVCTQLLSLPAGAFGPKYTSTEPSAFTCSDLFWLLRLQGSNLVPPASIGFPQARRPDTLAVDLPQV